MPDDTAKAEAKLRKLGERLRKAWAKRHPISEKSLETVRGAVREQWEKEQSTQRDQTPKPGPDKSRGRELSDPER